MGASLVLFSNRSGLDSHYDMAPWIIRSHHKNTPKHPSRIYSGYNFRKIKNNCVVCVQIKKHDHVQMSKLEATEMNG